MRPSIPYQVLSSTCRISTSSTICFNRPLRLSNALTSSSSSSLGASVSRRPILATSSKVNKPLLQLRGYASGQFDSSSASTRTRGAVGPFTLRAGAIFAMTGVGLYFYFQSEKAKIQAHKDQEHATAKIGRPNIGGPFVLTDQDGKLFSDKEMLGKWSLVYFGFTNCPDICPEELDKMGLVVKSIAKSHNVDILPIFITCDPVRDDVKSVKTYVSDFIPSLVGLTGTYEEIKKCCKAYRVYFSTPPDAKPTDDYLVDHSIFFYLMDPNAKFVDAFGRSMGPLEVENKIVKYLEMWERTDGKEGWSDMK